MLLTTASGYLALKNPFKRKLFLFFVVVFLMCWVFFAFFFHSSGKSFADILMLFSGKADSFLDNPQ
jgi:hypothetical protein